MPFEGLYLLHIADSQMQKQNYCTEGIFIFFQDLQNYKSVI